MDGIFHIYVYKYVYMSICDQLFTSIFQQYYQNCKQIVNSFTKNGTNKDEKWKTKQKQTKNVASTAADVSPRVRPGPH